MASVTLSVELSGEEEGGRESSTTSH